MASIVLATHFYIRNQLVPIFCVSNAGSNSLDALKDVNFVNFLVFIFMLLVGDPQMTAPRFKVLPHTVFHALSNDANGFSIERTCRRVGAKNKAFSTFHTFGNGIYSKIKAKRLDEKILDHSRSIPWEFSHQKSFGSYFFFSVITHMACGNKRK